MGIVSKQASIATALSYVGVLIGFVNVTLLMTRWFTPEEFGLREILLNVAIFSSQIAHLGTYRSLVKFFPFFSRDGKSDNGLLGIGLLVPLIGFLVVSGLIVLFKSQVTAFYIDKSPLYIDYFWWSFPLIFLLMYNNVFDAYLQSRSKTAYSVFLKSIFTRLVLTFLLVLYSFEILDFHGFIAAFVFSYALSILLFIQHLYSKGEFNLRFRPSFFSKRIRKVYFNYSAFSILSGASSVLVNKMDALMIAGFLGLASTAVYANAVYLTILIAIPSDSITRIAMPLLSKSWKGRNMEEIDSLYKKTALTQFLLGGVIFLLMWGSVDNFYELQGHDYSAGKIVFFILGIAKLINMIFGVNGSIIAVSKYYRFDTTTAVLLGVMTILTNYLLIPSYGIEGAAIATAFTILLFNLIRFFFVYQKLGIQPFTKKTFWVLGILVSGFILNTYLPALKNVFLDTAYRSFILALFVGFPSYFFEISEDINEFVDRNLAHLGIRI